MGLFLSIVTFEKKSLHDHIIQFWQYCPGPVYDDNHTSITIRLFMISSRSQVFLVIVLTQSHRSVQSFYEFLGLMTFITVILFKRFDKTLRNGALRIHSVPRSGWNDRLGQHDYHTGSTEFRTTEWNISRLRGLYPAYLQATLSVDHVIVFVLGTMYRPGEMSRTRVMKSNRVFNSVTL